jgi:hypothetical protein
VTKPQDLVTIDDGVLADRTMREFDQLLRIDLVKPDGKAQILLTRKHLKNAKLSKNVAYVTYSQPSALFKLARLCFAAGMARMFHRREVDLLHAVGFQMTSQLTEIEGLTKQYMEGLG